MKSVIIGVLLAITNIAFAAESPFEIESIDIDSKVVGTSLTMTHTTVLNNRGDSETLSLEFPKTVPKGWSSFETLFCSINGEEIPVEPLGRRITLEADVKGIDKITLVLRHSGAEPKLSRILPFGVDKIEYGLLVSFYDYYDVGLKPGTVNLSIDLTEAEVTSFEYKPEKTITQSDNKHILNLSYDNHQSMAPLEVTYSTEYLDLARSFVDSGAITSQYADKDTVMELAEKTPSFAKIGLYEHLKRTSIDSGDWETAYEMIKLIANSKRYEKYEPTEADVAIAILSGDEEAAKDYLEPILSDSIRVREQRLKDNELLGYTTDCSFPTWITAVDKAFKEGYDVNSPEMKTLATFLSSKAYSGDYNDILDLVKELGVSRDDVCYPYIFQRSLPRFADGHTIRHFGLPDWYISRIGEFASDYPDLWKNPTIQLFAASIYFEVGMAEYAAQLLFENQDIDVTSYGSHSRIFTNIDLLEGYYSPFKYNSGDDEIERNYINRAGTRGYNAALIELFYCDNKDKAIEYASATAERFPDSKFGVLSQELVEYIKRSEDK